jgi:hypothetical protein
MQNLAIRIPRGMDLKSEGDASNLAEPRGRATLGRYCLRRRVAVLGLPRETSTVYGESLLLSLALGRDPVELDDQRTVDSDRSAIQRTKG